MSDANLTRMLAPRSVAVIGASPSEGKAGNALVRSLEGFAGDVFPVHPKAAEVRGLAAYPSIAAVPGTIDLALLAVPAAASVAAVAECAEAGVGGAVVHAGGFAETGPEGEGLQDRLRDAAAGRLRVLGPNTSGFMAPPIGLCATFVRSASTVPAGRLAIVAQSGGVNHALAFGAAGQGVGVRLAVGLGNAVDIRFPDILEHLAEDGATGAVALAIEGVADGRRLMAAVERLVDRTPVVALVLGRGDVGDFAKSHTGALAAERPVMRAALRQAGAVLVDDTTALIDVAAALSRRRIASSASPGIGVVTGQAGPGLLLADALAVEGVRTPTLGESTKGKLQEELGDLTFLENPVDTGRPGPGFASVVRIVAEAEEIDALAVYLLDEPDAVDPRSVLAGAGSTVPVVLGTAGPADAVNAVREDLALEGISVLPTPERAAAVIAGLVGDATARARRAAAVPYPAPSIAVGRRPAATAWDEAAAKDLLATIGLPSPRRAVCDDTAAALEAAARFGGPVALKLLHPSLTHKTELGAVKLGVRNEEVPASLEELERVELPAGRRYLIEEMAAPGPDLLLGATRDPVYGPLVLLGAGGTEAEAVADATTRLAPLAPIEAAGMLDELAGAFRYRGFRGSAPVDEAALANAIVALGQLLIERPDIGEIEVNPLRVTADGLLALDALVIAPIRT
jgi:acyl-CoA synthetase (NDP forming)